MHGPISEAASETASGTLPLETHAPEAVAAFTRMNQRWPLIDGLRSDRCHLGTFLLKEFFHYAGLLQGSGDSPKRFFQVLE